MTHRRGPTRTQVHRRRLGALVALAILVAGIAVALGSGTKSGKAHGLSFDVGGYRLIHFERHSRAVGRDLGLNVIVPPRPGARGHRALLIFLHGRGGDESTFNDVVLNGLTSLGGRGPIVAFPAGGVHGYWHDRPEGKWEDWVMDEVLPFVSKRFGVNAHRLAIGGISMGGFGALNIALHHPGRFCAVGAHSPALWLEARETAPGAFESPADFARNDVIGSIQDDPGAFGSTRVWIDYGTEDPFRPYDEAFIAALEGGGVNFAHHSWSGGHEGSYWEAHWPEYQRFYLRALARCG